MITKILLCTFLGFGLVATADANSLYGPDGKFQGYNSSLGYRNFYAPSTSTSEGPSLYGPDGKFRGYDSSLANRNFYRQRAARR